MKARVSVRNGAIFTELNQLEGACKTYKELPRRIPARLQRPGPRRL